MNQEADAFRIDEEAKPYTHLKFKNDPDEFKFAIISDNAGSGRAGVLKAAMGMVNLLQPEFVACLGDLVEGYMSSSHEMADEDTYREWWQEVDEYLEQLEIPGRRLTNTWSSSRCPSSSCRAITTSTTPPH